MFHFIVLLYSSYFCCEDFELRGRVDAEFFSDADANEGRPKPLN